MQRDAGSVTIHVLSIVKMQTGERYVFLYDTPSLEVMIGYLHSFALDERLSFTHTDAAVLAARARVEKAIENLTPEV